MKRFEIQLILLLISILSSGCLYHTQSGPEPKIAHADSVSRSSVPPPGDYFKYTPLSEDPEIIKAKDEGDYTVQKLRFPTHTAYLYLPKQDLPAPGVIVLPISNGNYHSEQMATYLASNGLAALRFKTRKGILAKTKNGDRPLDEFEQNLRSYIVDILQGVDWMIKHPKIDGDRVGLVGISLGAITGSIVMGVEPRIKAGVLILGGGNLSGILMSSEEKSVRRVRESMKKHQGLSPEQIEERLRTQLHQLEPTHYADGQDPSQILMINAYLDKVIKRKYWKTLWKALGKPLLIELPTGHYTSILFLPYAKSKTLEHFQGLLGA